MFKCQFNLFMNYSPPPVNSVHPQLHSQTPRGPTVKYMDDTTIICRITNNNENSYQEEISHSDAQRTLLL